MPTLMLKFQGKTIKEYRLEKGKSLSIGRKDDNDVVIENLAVSGHHAKIDSVDDGFLLTDLKSKNGSFVNENLVTSHWLKHGDVMTIGKHSVVFAYEEGESRLHEAPDAMDQTMVMDTGKYRDMLAKSLPNGAKQVLEGEPVGILSFLSGGRGEMGITKKLAKIGKDSSSDIVVDGFMVGPTAATVSKRPNGYYLSYVGGMAKPKVNGETVKESVKLEEFDVIEIGSVKLQFIYKD
ncbi:MAG: FHA domain-containing protein [Desulfobacterales bacterium]|nr:FHA domain-containing protein [Desulfobacterales bacterium]